MSPAPETDWRSILTGFTAACLAVVVLALIAPIEDKYLLAGLAGATAVVSAVLAARAKPQTDLH
jgi:hypothetical protein